ncbi:hypothetical protein Tsp_15680, partial [Trichinella spiralis]|uniref:hypothetical protein n=1 Tax=Trichinella spiralis TaxID=6334 RepID=UPI0001EFEFE2
QITKIIVVKLAFGSQIQNFPLDQQQAFDGDFFVKIRQQKLHLFRPGILGLLGKLSDQFRFVRFRRHRGSDRPLQNCFGILNPQDGLLWVGILPHPLGSFERSPITQRLLTTSDNCGPPPGGQFHQKHALIRQQLIFKHIQQIDH